MAQADGYLTSDAHVPIFGGDTPESIFGRVLGALYDILIANRPMARPPLRGRGARDARRALCASPARSQPPRRHTRRAGRGSTPPRVLPVGTCAAYSRLLSSASSRCLDCRPSTDPRPGARSRLMTSGPRSKHATWLTSQPNWSPLGSSNSRRGVRRIRQARRHRKPSERSGGSTPKVECPTPSVRSSNKATQSHCPAWAPSQFSMSSPVRADSSSGDVEVTRRLYRASFSKL
jgi:hypothetical protein